MDKIINYLLLTIIFVFDPLAIALVIAANFAFEQLKNKTIENVYGETVPREKIFKVLNTEPEVKIVEVPVEVEKEVIVYLTSEEFAKSLHTHTDLTISGSGL
mgnify:CR=1 FL=1